MNQAAESADALLLREIVAQYRRQKEQADRALAQVPESAYRTPLGEPDGLSLSMQMRHVAGNLRSRWRDVLTSDGEKADRDRDGEFEDSPASVAELRAVWDDAWALTLTSLEALSAADLSRTITIRGKPLLLAEALVRNLDHTAHHVGQIVQLAKHWCGEGWSTLSIPRKR